MKYLMIPIAVCAGLNLGLAREIPDMRSLPIQQANNSLHYVVPVAVDGEHRHLILDSGSGGNVTLSLDFARSLGADLKESGASTDIKGRSVNYVATFDEVAVAGILKIRNTKTTLRDFSRLTTIEVNGEQDTVAGLVGSPFLDQVNVVFNPRGPSLLMPKAGVGPDDYCQAKQAEGYERLELTKGTHKYPVVTAKIEGREFDFLVDTGSAINIMLKDVAKELGLPLKESDNTASGPSGGKLKLLVTNLDRMILGNRALLPNTEFYVLPKTGSKSVSDGKYGGIIGVNTLRRWNMELDFGSYSLLMPAPR